MEKPEEFVARRKIWLLLSVALFAACLPFDTFCVSGECSGWPGYGVLLFGFLGMPLVLCQYDMARQSNPFLLQGSHPRCRQSTLSLPERFRLGIVGGRSCL